MVALAYPEVQTHAPLMGDEPEVKDKFSPELRELLELMGARVTALRDERGLTWASLSWRAEMHETLLRRWASAKTEPRVGGLVQLAKALTTSTDYLLGLTDDPTPASLRGGGDGSVSTPRGTPERRQGPPADELGPIGREPGTRASTPGVPRRRSSD